MHVKKCSFKVSIIFIDCQVLICNFYREQAWERWLNATKYSAKKDDYRYSSLETLTIVCRNTWLGNTLL